MKHITIIIVCAVSVLRISPAVHAQSDAETIARAVMAAPSRGQNDASVVKWADDGTRVVLRQGSNGLVCWDQSGWPGQRPFSVRCTAEANLPRVDQNREFLLKAGNASEAQAIFEAAEKSGTREVPEFGTSYYSMSGNDQATAQQHVTIAVPFATTESIGFPSEPSMTGAWLMTAGTSGAHIMIPGH